MLSKYKAAISFACHWILKCIRCQLINLHFRAVSMLLPSQCAVQVWFCRVLEYARRSCILAWDISFLVGMLNDKCASFLIRIDLCLKKLSAFIILFPQTVFPLLACQLLRWPYGKFRLEQEWGGAECGLEMALVLKHCCWGGMDSLSCLSVNVWVPGALPSKSCSWVFEHLLTWLRTRVGGLPCVGWGILVKLQLQ